MSEQKPRYLVSRVKSHQQGMVAHSYKIGIWEVESGGSKVQSQLWLHEIPFLLFYLFTSQN